MQRDCDYREFAWRHRRWKPRRRRSARSRAWEVDWLAEQFTDAGLAVEVNVAGEPHKLPTSLDLSAYRIVQETLTNAQSTPVPPWRGQQYLTSPTSWSWTSLMMDRVQAMTGTKQVEAEG